MKSVIYSSHLLFRLSFRGIPRTLPKRIFETSKERYFDTETLKFIAVKILKYKGKVREMALIYEEDNEKVVLISIHPLKILQKSNRIKSGRWTKYEKYAKNHSL